MWTHRQLGIDDPRFRGNRQRLAARQFSPRAVGVAAFPVRFGRTSPPLSQDDDRVVFVPLGEIRVADDAIGRLAITIPRHTAEPAHAVAAQVREKVFVRQPRIVFFRIDWPRLCGPFQQAVLNGRFD